MVPERKHDWNFMEDRQIHGETNVWSTVSSKIVNDLMMLALDEARDDLAVASSVFC